MIKYLEKKGFSPARRKGDHVFLKAPDGRRTTVPLHSELDRGTLMRILNQVGISRETFVKEWQ